MDGVKLIVIYRLGCFIKNKLLDVEQNLVKI